MTEDEQATNRRAVGGRERDERALQKLQAH
jgi:hypothetical protein